MNERASLTEQVGVTVLLFLEKRLEQRLKTYLLPLGIAGIGLSSVILGKPYLEHLLTDPKYSYFDQLSAVTPAMTHPLQGDWKQNPALVKILEKFPEHKDLRLLSQEGYDLNPFGNIYFQQSSKGALIAMDGSQLRAHLGETNTSLKRTVGFFFLDHQTPRASISIPEHFDIHLDDWLRDLKPSDYQKARKELSVKLSASVAAGVETISQYGSGSSKLATVPGTEPYRHFETRRIFYEERFTKDSGKLIARVIAFDPALLPH